ncbi:acyl-CoA dehydrogenase family protein [Streptomyces sp. NPDC044989]|uniref:acyl-CoA dehydrogenase family protein n=1 Tax=Streptomyces sp. NPDC044989 TaxID=3154336 RepID=UPI0033E1C09B
MSATPTTPPPALRPYLGETEEDVAWHELLWHEADAFAVEHAAPRAVRMEAAPGRVERKVAGLMAARGWFAITVPAALGGLGAGHVAKTILVHRIARVSAAAAAILQATLIPVGALLHFATYEQKCRWLPQVANGSLLLSIAVTEPQAGGHIGGIEATAERTGNEWVITGSKIHIGNSHLAGAGLKSKQIAAEESVADQVDRAPVLAHGVHVVAGEVAGDADQTRTAPQDLGRGRHPEPVADQVLELGTVVQQPGQVEQALVDHAGIRAALVLNDDRRAVLVQPERVDPAAVHRPGAVLARQEPDAQQRLHVRLDKALHIGLDLSKTRHDLGYGAVHRVRAEQLQARHLPLLGSEITNADEARDCFRKRL